MVRLTYGPVAVTAPTPSAADDPTAIGFVTTSLPAFRVQSGGTQETDLMRVDGVTPITVVTPDSATGVAEFQGPNGYTGMMWLQDASGRRWPVVPNDIADRTGGVSSVTVNGGTAQSGAVALTVPSVTGTADVPGLDTALSAKLDSTALQAYLDANSYNQIVTYTSGSALPAGYPDGTLYVQVAAAAALPVFAQLVQGSSGTDGTVFTTASVTPAAGSVCFLKVDSGSTGGTAAYPTSVTGAGLTWTSVASITTGLTNVASRLYVGTGTPSAGALTITFGATMQNAAWRLIQATNVPTTGTVVQAATATSASSSVATSLAGVNAKNSILSFYMANSTSQAANRSAGYNELGTQLSNTDLPVYLTDAMWRNDGVGAASWSSNTGENAQKTIITVEVASL